MAGSTPGGFFSRLFRGAGGPAKPQRGRKRASAEEKMKQQTAKFLRNLESENPGLYRDIMTQRLMHDLGYQPGGDAVEEDDPFDRMIETAEKMQKFNAIVNPREPKSTLGEIADVVKDLANSPAAQAVVAGAMRQGGPAPAPPLRYPPAAPPLPPPQLEAAAVVPQEPPPPVASPPEPEADIPDLPIDRFLPLLDLSPHEAAAKLAEMADADEANGDGRLWAQLEAITLQGPDSVLTMLRVIRFVPHYRETAKKLLANETWVRELVAALEAGMVDDSPPEKPVKATKAPKASQAERLAQS